MEWWIKTVELKFVTNYYHPLRTSNVSINIKLGRCKSFQESITIYQVLSTFIKRAKQNVSFVLRQMREKKIIGSI